MTQISHSFGRTLKWKDEFSNLVEECKTKINSFDDSFWNNNPHEDHKNAILEDCISEWRDTIINVCVELQNAIKNPDKLVDETLSIRLERVLFESAEIENQIRQKFFDEGHYDNIIYLEYMQNFGAGFPRAQLDLIREFNAIFDKIKIYCTGLMKELPSAKLMMISGEAGVGKTHGIFDIVSQRTNLGLRSLIIPGDCFFQQDPWVSIMEFVGISSSVGPEDFLSALNRTGELTEYPLIIFVDALNETKDSIQWQTWLPKMLSQIAQYKYLKLCVSCRSSAKYITLPQHLGNS